jgi:hypothetical protein
VDNTADAGLFLPVKIDFKFRLFKNIVLRNSEIRADDETLNINKVQLDPRQAGEDNPSLFGVSALFSPLRFSGLTRYFA